MVLGKQVPMFLLILLVLCMAHRWLRFCFLYIQLIPCTILAIVCHDNLFACPILHVSRIANVKPSTASEDDSTLTT